MTGNNTEQGSELVTEFSAKFATCHLPQLYAAVSTVPVFTTSKQVCCNNTCKLSDETKTNRTLILRSRAVRIYLETTRSVYGRRNWARVGMDKWNRIFRLFRFSGTLGQPRDVFPNFRNFTPENFRSIWFITRNFRNFRSNAKRPSTTFIFNSTTGIELHASVTSKG